MSHDRETLGRIVREIWVDFAREQPDPKPHHLAPWEALSEPMKEVDRRIGERLFVLGREEVEGLRSQRDLLYRLLERVYAWGGITGERDPTVQPTADVTADGAVDGVDLGRFLYNEPPVGPAWPAPMDEEEE